MRFSKRTVSVLALAAGANLACRGHLPPTEPPPSIPEDPSASTNDSPTAGPLAGPAAPLPGADTNKGGSNVLPLPSPSSGSGGSVP
jgi:hypothetical protein